METKYTKGEWILNESSCQIVSSNDCSKNGGIDLIAQCYTGFNYALTLDECKANSKLMAASKDLLEAAKEAKEYLSKINSGDEGDQAYQSLERAIKKATE